MRRPSIGTLALAPPGDPDRVRALVAVLRRLSGSDTGSVGMVRIVAMGGDGIGLEVVDAACTVPDRAAGRLGRDLAS